jgi:hypothetical protein
MCLLLARPVSPAHAHADAPEGSEDESADEAVSRDVMKKQAATLVEARTAKPKKGRNDD